MKLMQPFVKTEIKVGQKVMAGERSIYTVIKIITMKTDDGSILGSWLTPLAMLIIEPGKQYAVSLTESRISLEEILDLAPSLEIVIEKARKIHRIKIT